MIERRFLDKVDVPLDLSDCWLWTACKNSKGYGTFRGDHSQWLLAHRQSYLLFNGEIADGQLVLHSCDNRGCVNPYHLRLGTQADNMRDMHKRGRAVKPSGGWETRRRNQICT